MGKHRTIRGLTWGHSRGYVPVVAVGQSITDVDPTVRFTWEQVSLKEFGEGNLEELSQSFDIIVLDYPFIGTVAAAGAIYALDGLFDEQYLTSLGDRFVGPSLDSYRYDGRLWSLPIDAATQVSARRADLLADLGADDPTTWDEVIELAEATGRVGLPLAPLAASGTFWTLCNSLGEAPFATDSAVVSNAVGEEALHLMKRLFAFLPRVCMDLNPIQLLGRMSTSDEFVLAPVLYGYNNYSRRGFSQHRVEFRPAITGRLNEGVGATVGGAGVSVSRGANHLDICRTFCERVVSVEVQTGTYLLAGGQPAAKEAWTEGQGDRITNGFFGNVLGAMERGYVRPNYPGFTVAQSRCAELIREFLADGRPAGDVLADMDDAYIASLRALA